MKTRLQEKQAFHILLKRNVYRFFYYLVTRCGTVYGGRVINPMDYTLKN